MYSSRTEGAALIQDAVYTKGTKKVDILNFKLKVLLLIDFIF